MENQQDPTILELHRLEHVLRGLDGDPDVVPYRKAANSPEGALRRAVTSAILDYSPFPLLAAAELLLTECRAADHADPVWQEFLLRLSQAEVEAFTRAARTARARGAPQYVGPPHLWAVT